MILLPINIFEQNTYPMRMTEMDGLVWPYGIAVARGGKHHFAKPAQTL